MGHGEDTSEVNGLRSLVRSLEGLIDDFPRALLHQVLVFDQSVTRLPERIYSVPVPAESRTTTIKTVMCDLTSRLLAEMANHAKSLQVLSTLDSPKEPQRSFGKLDGNLFTVPAHTHSNSGSGSSQSFSSVGKNPRYDYRTSMPANLPSKSDSGRSTPDSRPASPSNDPRPFSTFAKQVTGSTSPPRHPNPMLNDRTEGRSRASASALSASNLGDRERNKGKGRIGIVIGMMYLLAGRWPDAVKELVQSAAVARNCSDYLWHAKAMDCVLVCLLMFAWAGMDFRVSLHQIDKSNPCAHRLS